MGLNSVIKGFVSQMEKVDTMNMNMLEHWRGRVFGIAKDLDESTNTARQESFKGDIIVAAKHFIGATLDRPDTILHRLEPEVQEKRKRTLIIADERLNSFEAPPPGWSQIMQAAALDDEELLKRNLKGLNEVGNASLIEMRDHITPLSSTNDRKERGHQAPSISKAQKAHERLVKKFYWLSTEGTSEPSIVIGICDMRENSEIERYLITFEDTFSDLVEMILESDNTASLPDFWCRRNDVSKNQVTESAAWWECQTASTRVADAIMDQKRGEVRNAGNENQEPRKVDIRSVITEGEYLVVLVAKDGSENGFPVDIPRNYRQPASVHFQERVFPNEKVSKLLLMESGFDASSMIFDKRLFNHQSNPLFVELQVADQDTSKGKGRVKGRDSSHIRCV